MNLLWDVYDVIVFGTLLGVLANALCNLLVFRTPRLNLKRGGSLGRVSVLIPARNEALRIGPCIRSLVRQNYPDLEIIVVNDRSDDETEFVVRAEGFSDEGRLRIINGQSLPEGWIGKPWACDQLAAAATGEWLLFTDADTVYEGDAVTLLLDHAQRTRADLLSAWPAQETGSWSEMLVIPQVYLLVVGFLPQWLLVLLERVPGFAGKLPRRFLRSLGAANGQCLLFRKESYRKIGGHKVVRDHLVEDLALGREVARRVPEGMRLINCDGRTILRCRMYTRFSEVWEGFSKNLRPAFENSGGAFFVSLLVQAIAFVSPFLLAPLTGDPVLWGACVFVWLIRFALFLRFGGSLLSVLLHPVGHALALLISLNSWRKCRGDGVTWKGRTYKMLSDGGIDRQRS